MSDFIKVRYRHFGTDPNGPPTFDIQGLHQGMTISIDPGTAYALRDALSAALDDYEIEQKERERK